MKADGTAMEVSRACLSHSSEIRRMHILLTCVRDVSVHDDGTNLLHTVPRLPTICPQVFSKIVRWLGSVLSHGLGAICTGRPVRLVP